MATAVAADTTAETVAQTKREKDEKPLHAEAEAVLDKLAPEENQKVELAFDNPPEFLKSSLEVENAEAKETRDGAVEGEKLFGSPLLAANDATEENNSFSAVREAIERTSKVEEETSHILSPKGENRVDQDMEVLLNRGVLSKESQEIAADPPKIVDKDDDGCRTLEESWVHTDAVNTYAADLIAKLKAGSENSGDEVCKEDDSTKNILTTETGFPKDDHLKTSFQRQDDKEPDSLSIPEGKHVDSLLTVSRDDKKDETVKEEKSLPETSPLSTLSTEETGSTEAGSSEADPELQLPSCKNKEDKIVKENFSQCNNSSDKISSHIEHQMEYNEVETENVQGTNDLSGNQLVASEIKETSLDNAALISERPAPLTEVCKTVSESGINMNKTDDDHQPTSLEKDTTVDDGLSIACKAQENLKEKVDDSITEHEKNLPREREEQISTKASRGLYTGGNENIAVCEVIQEVGQQGTDEKSQDNADAKCSFSENEPEKKNLNAAHEEIERSGLQQKIEPTTFSKEFIPVKNKEGELRGESKDMTADSDNTNDKKTLMEKELHEEMATIADTAETTNKTKGENDEETLPEEPEIGLDKLAPTESKKVEIENAQEFLKNNIEVEDVKNAKEGSDKTAEGEKMTELASTAKAIIEENNSLAEPIGKPSKTESKMQEILSSEGENREDQDTGIILNRGIPPYEPLQEAEEPSKVLDKGDDGGMTPGENSVQTDAIINCAADLTGNLNEDGEKSGEVCNENDSTQNVLITETSSPKDNSSTTNIQGMQAKEQDKFFIPEGMTLGILVVESSDDKEYEKVEEENCLAETSEIAHVGIQSLSSNSNNAHAVTGSPFNTSVTEETGLIKAGSSEEEPESPKEKLGNSTTEHEENLTKESEEQASTEAPRGLHIDGNETVAVCAVISEVKLQVTTEMSKDDADSKNSTCKNEAEKNLDAAQEEIERSGLQQNNESTTFSKELISDKSDGDILKGQSEDTTSHSENTNYGTTLQEKLHEEMATITDIAEGMSEAKRENDEKMLPVEPEVILDKLAPEEANKVEIDYPHEFLENNAEGNDGTVGVEKIIELPSVAKAIEEHYSSAEPIEKPIKTENEMPEKLFSEGENREGQDAGIILNRGIPPNESEHEAEEPSKVLDRDDDEGMTPEENLVQADAVMNCAADLTKSLKEDGEESGDVCSENDSTQNNQATKTSFPKDDSNETNFQRMEDKEQNKVFIPEGKSMDSLVVESSNDKEYEQVEKEECLAGTSEIASRGIQSPGSDSKNAQAVTGSPLSTSVTEETSSVKSGTGKVDSESVEASPDTIEDELVKKETFSQDNKRDQICAQIEHEITLNEVETKDVQGVNYFLGSQLVASEIKDTTLDEDTPVIPKPADSTRVPETVLQVDINMNDNDDNQQSKSLEKDTMVDGSLSAACEAQENPNEKLSDLIMEHGENLPKESEKQAAMEGLRGLHTDDNETVAVCEGISEVKQQRTTLMSKDEADSKNSTCENEAEKSVNAAQEEIERSGLQQNTELTFGNELISSVNAAQEEIGRSGLQQNTELTFGKELISNKRDDGIFEGESGEKLSHSKNMNDGIALHEKQLHEEMATIADIAEETSETKRENDDKTLPVEPEAVLNKLVPEENKVEIDNPHEFLKNNEVGSDGTVEGEKVIELPSVAKPIFEEHNSSRAPIGKPSKTEDEMSEKLFSEGKNREGQDEGIILNRGIPPNENQQEAEEPSEVLDKDDGEVMTPEETSVQADAVTNCAAGLAENLKEDGEKSGEVCNENESTRSILATKTNFPEDNSSETNFHRMEDKKQEKVFIPEGKSMDSLVVESTDDEYERAEEEECLAETSKNFQAVTASPLSTSVTAETGSVKAGTSEVDPESLKASSDTIEGEIVKEEAFSQDNKRDQICTQIEHETACNDMETENVQGVDDLLGTELVTYEFKETTLNEAAPTIPKPEDSAHLQEVSTTVLQVEINTNDNEDNNQSKILEKDTILDRCLSTACDVQENPKEKLIDSITEHEGNLPKESEEQISTEASRGLHIDETETIAVCVISEVKQHGTVEMPKDDADSKNSICQNEAEKNLNAAQEEIERSCLQQNTEPTTFSKELISEQSNEGILKKESEDKASHSENTNEGITPQKKQLHKKMATIIDIAEDTSETKRENSEKNLPDEHEAVLDKLAPDENKKVEIDNPHEILKSKEEGSDGTFKGEKMIELPSVAKPIIEENNSSTEPIEKPSKTEDDMPEKLFSEGENREGQDMEIILNRAIPPNGSHQEAEEPSKVIEKDDDEEMTPEETLEQVDAVINCAADLTENLKNDGEKSEVCNETDSAQRILATNTSFPNDDFSKKNFQGMEDKEQDKVFIPEGNMDSLVVESHDDKEDGKVKKEESLAETQKIPLMEIQSLSSDSMDAHTVTDNPLSASPTEETGSEKAGSCEVEPKSVKVSSEMSEAEIVKKEIFSHGSSSDQISSQIEHSIECDEVETETIQGVNDLLGSQLVASGLGEGTPVSEKPADPAPLTEVCKTVLEGGLRMNENEEDHQCKILEKDNIVDDSITEHEENITRASEEQASEEESRRLHGDETETVAVHDVISEVEQQDTAEMSKDDVDSKDSLFEYESEKENLHAACEETDKAALPQNTEQTAFNGELTSVKDDEVLRAESEDKAAHLDNKVKINPQEKNVLTLDLDKAKSILHNENSAWANYSRIDEKPEEQIYTATDIPKEELKHAYEASGMPEIKVLNDTSMQGQSDIDLILACPTDIHGAEDTVENSNAMCHEEVADMENQEDQIKQDSPQRAESKISKDCICSNAIIDKEESLNSSTPSTEEARSNEEDAMESKEEIKEPITEATYHNFQTAHADPEEQVIYVLTNPHNTMQSAEEKMLLKEIDVHVQKSSVLKNSEENEEQISETAELLTEATGEMEVELVKVQGNMAPVSSSLASEKNVDTRNEIEMNTVETDTIANWENVSGLNRKVNVDTMAAGEHTDTREMRLHEEQIEACGLSKNDDEVASLLQEENPITKTVNETSIKTSKSFDSSKGIAESSSPPETREDRLTKEILLEEKHSGINSEGRSMNDLEKEKLELNEKSLKHRTEDFKMNSSNSITKVHPESVQPVEEHIPINQSVAEEDDESITSSGALMPSTEDICPQKVTVTGSKPETKVLDKTQAGSRNEEIKEECTTAEDSEMEPQECYSEANTFYTQSVENEKIIEVGAAETSKYEDSKMVQDKLLFRNSNVEAANLDASYSTNKEIQQAQLEEAYVEKSEVVPEKSDLVDESASEVPKLEKPLEAEKIGMVEENLAETETEEIVIKKTNDENEIIKADISSEQTQVADQSDIVKSSLDCPEEVLSPGTYQEDELNPEENESEKLGENESIKVSKNFENTCFNENINEQTRSVVRPAEQPHEISCIDHPVAESFQKDENNTDEIDLREQTKGLGCEYTKKDDTAPDEEEEASTENNAEAEGSAAQDSKVNILHAIETVVAEESHDGNGKEISKMPMLQEQVKHSVADEKQNEELQSIEDGSDIGKTLDDKERLDSCTKVPEEGITGEADRSQKTESSTPSVSECVQLMQQEQILITVQTEIQELETEKVSGAPSETELNQTKTNEASMNTSEETSLEHKHDEIQSNVTTDTQVLTHIKDSDIAEEECPFDLKVTNIEQSKCSAYESYEAVPTEAIPNISTECIALRAKKSQGAKPELQEENATESLMQGSEEKTTEMARDGETEVQQKNLDFSFNIKDSAMENSSTETAQKDVQDNIDIIKSAQEHVAGHPYELQNDEADPTKIQIDSSTVSEEKGFKNETTEAASNAFAEAAGLECREDVKTQVEVNKIIFRSQTMESTTLSDSNLMLRSIEESLQVTEHKETKSQTEKLLDFPHHKDSDTIQPMELPFDFIEIKNNIEDKQEQHESMVAVSNKEFASEADPHGNSGVKTSSEDNDSQQMQQNSEATTTQNDIEEMKPENDDEKKTNFEGLVCQEEKRTADDCKEIMDTSHTPSTILQGSIEQILKPKLSEDNEAKKVEQIQSMQEEDETKNMETVDFKDIIQSTQEKETALLSAPRKDAEEPNASTDVNISSDNINASQLPQDRSVEIFHFGEGRLLPPGAEEMEIKCAEEERTSNEKKGEEKKEIVNAQDAPQETIAVGYREGETSGECKPVTELFSSMETSNLSEVSHLYDSTNKISPVSNKTETRDAFEKLHVPADGRGVQEVTTVGSVIQDMREQDESLTLEPNPETQVEAELSEREDAKISCKDGEQLKEDTKAGRTLIKVEAMEHEKITKAEAILEGSAYREENITSDGCSQMMETAETDQIVDITSEDPVRVTQNKHEEEAYPLPASEGKVVLEPQEDSAVKTHQASDEPIAIKDFVHISQNMHEEETNPQHSPGKLETELNETANGSTSNENEKVQQATSQYTSSAEIQKAGDVIIASDDSVELTRNMHEEEARHLPASGEVETEPNDGKETILPPQEDATSKSHQPSDEPIASENDIHTNVQGEEPYPLPASRKVETEQNEDTEGNNSHANENVLDVPQFGTAESHQARDETTESSRTEESNSNGNKNVIKHAEDETKEATERCVPTKARDETSIAGVPQVSSKEREVIFDKEEEQASKVETAEYEEARSDDEEEQGGEHKGEDSGPEAPVIVENAAGDADVKAAKKKHHNILSGVGSKVKHSIAKVKKVITGKSSPTKQHLPK